jgi:hypothetical protein
MILGTLSSFYCFSLFREISLPLFKMPIPPSLPSPLRCRCRASNVVGVLNMNIH